MNTNTTAANDNLDPNGTEEKVAAAHNRLATALEKGKLAWGRVQEKACDGAKEINQVVRTHPYEASGVAFGVGVLLGFLLTRRNH